MIHLAVAVVAVVIVVVTVVAGDDDDDDVSGREEEKGVNDFYRFVKKIHFTFFNSFEMKLDENVHSICGTTET